MGADAWYAPSVKDCYVLGLMNGSGAHTFSPDGMFTIAEGLTIAARLNDLYGGGSGRIPAADGQWYQGAVNDCAEKGIIRAGEYTQYEKNATRAEPAGILYYGVYNSPEESGLVISEYKTGMYYDKLEYIGEGCLIGTYGNQKYLLHV